MKLPEVCIKHPVLACVMSIAIVLIGLVSLQSLPIQYFPDHRSPNATVSASIPGASADFMSNNVADKLISAATGLESVKTMNTDCQEGSCKLQIFFKDNVSEVKYASLMNNLRSKVEAINNFPPSMIDKPVVTDDSSENALPSNIITFEATGNITKRQMYNLISDQLIPQFRHISGVGGVWGPYGGSSQAIHVWLNPEKMMALGITANDVVSTLSKYNATFTAGTIKGQARDFSINPVNSVSSVADVRNLVLRYDNGNIVRVGDVANVVMDDATDTPSILHINSKLGMSIQTLPLKSENPVVVAKRVKAAMANMKLPDTVKMKMVYNQANFIQASIDEGFKTLVEAIVLVGIVVVIFLGSVRFALIPLITIPVCVIGVFAVMAALGFTINVLTILAIILAIGLVVDDAIVVVENCYRHIEQGKPPLKAALESSREIIAPVIAMTLTLAAVFFPIGLMSGLTADLFHQFAFTLASSVLISGFVALTLSPMMSAFILKPASHTSKWFKWVDDKLDKTTHYYLALLKKAFTKKAGLLVVAVILIATASAATWFMPKTLLPVEDTGFISVSAKASSSVGRNYHLQNNAQLNSIFKGDPDIAANMSYIESEPENHLLLTPWNERKDSIEEIISRLMAKAKQQVLAYKVSMSVRAADNLNLPTGLVLELTTVNKDIKALGVSAAKVKEVLENYPGVANVNNSMQRDQLRFDLKIDQNAAVLSNVDYSDITSALSTFLGSVKAADLKMKDGYTYPIQVQVNRKSLSDFKVLDKLYVMSKAGQQLPLSQFVSIKQVTSESHIKTFMGLDNAEITADIMPGYSASDVETYVNQHVPELLQSGQNYQFNGVIENLHESSHGMTLLFGMALIFIFLILAAQFESFIEPLIILLTVPLCLVGALLTLKVFGQSLNIYSKIGLLTLVGLVTKHGILLVEFANKQQKEKGLSAYDAAIESAKSRLRPILMTSLTMIIGSLPLAFAVGPGSVGRINIGLVLVGGLILGTVFSLFLVPIAYVAMAKLREQDIIKRLKQLRTSNVKA
ncbi:efflux RND transporter permease subunit [Photobacterium leiognathi]|uniref:efflux RND transporter permease subunit n=1 Tax=Photobacterium leiognathi TaxID=553611 RepID=UPI002980A3DB|nr:efflux RND transporter permease subunit [Photobacterium leiognathi]